MAADPDLVLHWATARALSRGISAPVRDGAAWRCDTGLPHETARYIFADLGPEVTALAERIGAPRLFLKVCADAEAVRAALPPRWALQPPGFMMRCDGGMRGEAACPDGYVPHLEHSGPVAVARIVAPDGTLAASGRAARYRDVLVYDQIVTAPEHQRRGLGRAVMRALETAGEGGGGRQILVATDAGRQLYQTLGWRVISPYTTAVIPG